MAKASAQKHFEENKGFRLFHFWEGGADGLHNLPVQT